MGAERRRSTRLLAEKPEHCVVDFSDIVMPGMNGIELGEEIRKRYPHMPVILASGYSHAVTQRHGQVFKLLQKPYAIDELARTL
ncbi:response regulator [Caballeronia sp. DA-9]|uniref:response regulator n=1 Tax=Caballeronia sp. DA-9 TaxID=3436237 RepID=UPI003F667D2C